MEGGSEAPTAGTTDLKTTPSLARTGRPAWSPPPQSSWPCSVQHGSSPPEERRKLADDPNLGAWHPSQLPSDPTWKQNRQISGDSVRQQKDPPSLATTSSESRKHPGAGSTPNPKPDPNGTGHPPPRCVSPWQIGEREESPEPLPNEGDAELPCWGSETESLLDDANSWSRWCCRKTLLQNAPWEEGDNPRAPSLLQGAPLHWWRDEPPPRTTDRNENGFPPTLVQHVGPEHQLWKMGLQRHTFV